jgi:hypothetical protein
LGVTVTNTGDFDPAEAIRQHRAEQEAETQRIEDEKRRAREREDKHRADMVKLLRHAEEQLGEIHDPIVSEFVIEETWVTRHLFKRLRHHRRQKAIYHGSWLALASTTHERRSTSRRGLVKLRRPHVGYAFAQIDDWDPRNNAHFEIHLTNDFGEELSSRPLWGGNFRIVASLEDAVDSIKTLPSQEQRAMSAIGTLAKAVAQVLNFVENGQPPNPEVIPYEY